MQLYSEICQWKRRSIFQQLKQKDKCNKNVEKNFRTQKFIN